MANVDSNTKRAQQLGMPFGTACNRLRKMVLFDILKRFGLNVCFRCNAPIEAPADLSLEHKREWENVSPDLFWDLENITFSHCKCNYGNGHKGKAMYGQRPSAPDGMAWCSGHKQFLDRGKFHADASNTNGLHDYCAECRSKSAANYSRESRW